MKYEISVVDGLRSHLAAQKKDPNNPNPSDIILGRNARTLVQPRQLAVEN